MQKFGSNEYFITSKCNCKTYIVLIKNMISTPRKTPVMKSYIVAIIPYFLAYPDIKC